MLSHFGTQTIETERLLLRPFHYTDDDDMLAYWVSDPKIQSLYSEPTYTTKEEVRELLEKYISSYERPDYYRWAVIEKASNICIGQIAIFLVDSKNHFCEIEYALGSKFHRRGYASEAVKSILDFSFNKVNFHKVQVCHKEGNIASQGVIRKCNFTYEGTLRDFFFMDGKYVNRLYYSILKDEYAEITDTSSIINKTEILSKLCYTELVYERINKKLNTKLSKAQIERMLLTVIKETNEEFFQKTGKNIYVINHENNIRITINSYTYRVITVDRITKKHSKVRDYTI